MRRPWWKRKAFSIPVMFLLIYGLLWTVCWIFKLQIEPHFSIGTWWSWIQWGLPFFVAGVLTLSRLAKQKAFSGIEHGSAKWGTKKEAAQFRDSVFQNNILLSATEWLSLNMQKCKRNLHVMVFGASGTGKSRYYVKPNVCQMNSCYVITDPSGEHLRSEGQMLKDNGYEIKVFNVYDMKNSMHFNPFHYFKKISDIRQFIEILMANTSGDTSDPRHTEDFWVKAERLWLMSHIAYMMETLTPEQVNINTLMMMLTSSDAREDDEEYQNGVDILFENLGNENPNSFAYKQYRKYKQAAGKTAKSILISISVRLSDFDIPMVANLFQDDELELEKIGREKTALFLIMDETAKTYNYMIAILIDVMINQLKKTAIASPGMKLPILTQCILDEIINIGRFPSLDLWTRTLRKYEVSLQFLIQDYAGTKLLYKDGAKSIVGNCDTVIFLGGKEEDTVKFVSENLVGKTTIETTSYSGSGNAKSIGTSGYSKQEQAQGRSLMDAAEVGKLSDDECIVAIRGVNPFKSKKYNLTKHPNYSLLADGNEGYSYKRSDLKLEEIAAGSVELYTIPEFIKN